MNIKEKLDILRSIEALSYDYKQVFDRSLLKKAIQDDLNNLFISKEQSYKDIENTNALEFEINIKDIDLSLTNGLFFDGDVYHNFDPNEERIRLEYSAKDIWKLDLIKKIYNL